VCVPVCALRLSMLRSGRCPRGLGARLSPSGFPNPWQVSTSPTGTPTLQSKTLPVVHEMQAISLRSSTTSDVQFVDLLTPVQHEVQLIQTHVTPIPEVQSFRTAQGTVINEVQVGSDSPESLARPPPAVLSPCWQHIMPETRAPRAFPSLSLALSLSPTEHHDHPAGRG
jgi:hypothetical protein